MCRYLYIYFFGMYIYIYIYIYICINSFKYKLNGVPTYLSIWPHHWLNRVEVVSSKNLLYSLLELIEF